MARGKNKGLNATAANIRHIKEYVGLTDTYDVVPRRPRLPEKNRVENLGITSPLFLSHMTVACQLQQVNQALRMLSYKMQSPRPQDNIREPGTRTRRGHQSNEPLKICCPQGSSRSLKPDKQNARGADELDKEDEDETEEDLEENESKDEPDEPGGLEDALNEPEEPEDLEDAPYKPGGRGQRGG
ncbi:hypothetical protein P152DRAFT_476840 [Eremomyces bilateralis CBS 781.70]|uniref:Uncharacterized protein n=1 Tax=Eremomyces bilateralis CBS 781.70 TaxID=1392243 RepID=A0A6G1FTK1_9PEZI|nr:uncharacterized protein P152DRAFT_476840 [Eremomyces bilateralis CBS 781.70]KAF1809083.1 hypothetical protein P152DRAFT_476840 [Eremomyces bilateralis CBS 781.70]